MFYEDENNCVCCGNTIPEGSMVCSECIQKWTEDNLFGLDSSVDRGKDTESSYYGVLKTKIQKINADWKDVKNECRHTTNKESTDIPVTKDFIKKILISEHSPIRLVRIKWRWEGIKSWISVHFARHWLGWDKWISTQRTDRTGVPRDKSPQDTPVNMDVEANPQSLINVARYRLCRQASKETREYMEDLKISIKEAGQKEISDVMVPNCIYRMGCPEMSHCGYLNNFLKWCKENNKDFNLFNIQERYTLYNEFFYSKR